MVQYNAILSNKKVAINTHIGTADTVTGRSKSEEQIKVGPSGENKTAKLIRVLPFPNVGPNLVYVSDVSEMNILLSKRTRYVVTFVKEGPS